MFISKVRFEPGSHKIRVYKAMHSPARTSKWTNFKRLLPPKFSAVVLILSSDRQENVGGFSITREDVRLPRYNVV